MSFEQDRQITEVQHASYFDNLRAHARQVAALSGVIGLTAAAAFAGPAYGAEAPGANGTGGVTTSAPTPEGTPPVPVDPAAPPAYQVPQAFCQGKVATILGTAGSDTLVGTKGPDVIMGLEGDDTISGAEGDDIICGGEGKDILTGGSGNDLLSGGGDNDTLDGQAGTDKLIGNDDDDLLTGSASDSLRGNDGNDELVGGKMNGGKGKDWCRQGASSTKCEANRPRIRIPGISAKTGTGALFTYDINMEAGIGGMDTEAIGEEIDGILASPDGWAQRSGDVAVQRVAKDANTHIILATPDTVDALCAAGGMDTEGKVSCRVGERVILNLSRWRNAVSHWKGTITTYRKMLVNHEFGHRLGMDHDLCTGGYAKVMTQQTYRDKMANCKENSTPLDSEIAQLQAIH